MEKEKYIAIYSRKSKYTGKGESINNQIEKCKKYLSYKNIKEKIKIYKDEGYTGYNTKRPEFQKLLEDIKQGKIEMLIVYKLDRISRNVTDFCNLKELFEKKKISFISVTEQFDTSTPLGNAMLMISSVFAQLERDTIAERIKDNMYELAKKGRWLGGNTPLGYTSEKIEIIKNNKKRNQYTLKQIPEEVKLIKLLWKKLLELKGISRLESYLMKNNIKTRRGNYFSRFALISIFKNPVYVIADPKIIKFFKDRGAYIYKEKINNKNGLIAYSKRQEKKGKTQREKEVKEWIISIGNHEGIINSTDFITTWNLLDKNKDKRFRKPKENESILSGLIKCKKCNSFMRPRLRKTYYRDKRNFSYLCELKEKSRKSLCNAKNIDGLKTDKIIIDEISKIKVPTNLIKKYLRKKTIKKNNNLKKELNENQIKINNLIKQISVINQDIIDDIQKEIKTLKLKNIEIKEKLKNEKIDKKEIKKTSKKIIENHMKLFNQINLINKKTLIRIIIEKIQVEENNIYITLKP